MNNQKSKSVGSLATKVHCAQLPEKITLGIRHDWFLLCLAGDYIWYSEKENILSLAKSNSPQCCSSQLTIYLLQLTGGGVFYDEIILIIHPHLFLYEPKEVLVYKEIVSWDELWQ